MKSNPVGWFEIYVQDMSRAKAFYEAVFQGVLTPLRILTRKASLTWRCGHSPCRWMAIGASGALVRMAGCPSGGSTLVYFTCDDCAIEAARAASNGGSVFKEKMSIGEYGFIALVSDTEGNLIGLHSMQ